MTADAGGVAGRAGRVPPMGPIGRMVPGPVGAAGADAPPARGAAVEGAAGGDDEPSPADVPAEGALAGRGCAAGPGETTPGGGAAGGICSVGGVNSGVFGRSGRENAAPDAAGAPTKSSMLTSAPPIVITPPQMEQRARAPASGTFAGSMRNTERHSGQATFTCPPSRQGNRSARAASPLRRPDPGGGRWNTRSLSKSSRNSSFRWQAH